jgi:hypothetical protein
LQGCLPPCLLEPSMTLGDAGGRGGLTIVGHPESGLGERAHWPSDIPVGAGDEGMMDRPAFPIRLLFQLIDQRDGEARNPAPRFGRSWAFSWRCVGSQIIDRSACDDDRRFAPSHGGAPPEHAPHRDPRLRRRPRRRDLSRADRFRNPVEGWRHRRAAGNRPRLVQSDKSRRARRFFSDRRTLRPRSAAAPLCAGRAAHTINGTRLRRKQMTSLDFRRRQQKLAQSNR